VSSMAVILENQAKQIVNEASQTGTGGIGTGTAGEQWAGVALPLIRRVFGEIAAKEFVSVQPMQLPSGLVFYLDFKYNNAQPGFAALGSLYGITSGANDPTGGLYGTGRYGYSINETSSNATGTVTTSIGGITWQEVNFEPTLSASVALTTQSIRKIQVPVSSLPGYDTTAIRSFRIASGSGALLSTAQEAAQFQRYTSNDGTNLNFYVSSSYFNGGILSGSTTLTVNVFYSLQPTDTSRGDFEDRSTRPLTGSNAIPEINIELASVPIVAKSRKLKAQWTPEFTQDLKAYHSVDPEQELTALMSEYISMEIDLEILDMLINAAPTVDYWSVAVATEYDSTISNFRTTGSNGSFYTKSTWYQTLGIKVQKMSNKIHQKTMRGGANFLVCSPTTATILESIPGYAAATDGDKMEFAMGVQKVGQLNSRWKVYKNPYMVENIILMGYRGNQFLETGAAYAPYIPLIMTPLLYDPDTFTPRKGLMTRYAKIVTRPEFYGKIVVANLEMV
jgi:hypothetical protein